MTDVTQRMRESGGAVIAEMVHSHEIISHEELAERVFEAMVGARENEPAPPFVIPYQRASA